MNEQEKEEIKQIKLYLAKRGIEIDESKLTPDQTLLLRALIEELSKEQWR